MLRRLGIAVVALVLPACSGETDNPELRDVARQYSEAYCEKLAECMGEEAFAAAYPNGQADCASRTLTITGTNEKSICSQEHWDTCTEDLKKTTCTVAEPGFSRPKIPDSCQGC